MRLQQLSQLVITKDTSDQLLLDLILANRGLSKKLIPEFLKPAHPRLYSGFNTALEIFKDYFSGFQKSKNILIYGDYDVDGITATAILWQTLHSLGYKVDPFIPDREVDGYGFKAVSFDRIQQDKNKNYDLLITVDNGIVAASEFQKIKQTQDIDIIVIDHHEPDKTVTDLTSAITHLIHSTTVSGAALAWFAARQLDKNADLGLAALGTVADCMPLLGINRSLVVHGLRELRLNPCPGLRKLMEAAKVKPDQLSAYHLGYIIGPRINAVGRLSNPMDALRLLCAPSAATAQKYVSILNNYNRDRQLLQSDSLDLAEKSINHNGDKLILVADKSYLPGIIGLIAGRLTEKYALPSIAISLNGEVAKGSCRSIPQLNIIDTLRSVSHLFIDVGGHAGAAGFSIKEENIPLLKTQLTEIINRQLKDTDLEPKIEVEAEMKLAAATVKNCQILSQLEPFGIGNPEPLFVFKQLTIKDKRLVGKNADHLSLRLDDPGTKTIENTTTSAIAFKKGSLADSLKVGDTVDIVASLSANTWNGVTTPQLLVKEIIPS